MQAIREACWREEALTIRYTDSQGQQTERDIWPLAIVYLDRSLMLLSWCCLRQAFRMFRADRVSMTTLTGASFRPQRVGLLRTYIA